MTSNYHTPIPASPMQEATAGLFNSRLSDLDTHLGDAITVGQWNAAELAAARAPYNSLDARLDTIIGGYVGGNIATKTNGTAAAGQKVVTVLDTTGFIAGAYAAYQLVSGVVEYNLIASITPTTTLTLTTDIGATGIASGVYIGMISVSEYWAANSIPHAGSLTLPQAMSAVGRNVRNVMAYGAIGDGSTDDTAAFLEALADGDTIEIPAEKTFKVTSTLTLTDNHTIMGNGATSIIKFEPSADNDNLIEATECWNLRLLNFKITGTNAKSDNAILLTNVNAVTIQNVQIYGAHGTPTAFAFTEAAIHIAADTNAGPNNSADIRITNTLIQCIEGNGVMLDGDYGSIMFLHHCRLQAINGYGVYSKMLNAQSNSVTLDTCIIDGAYAGNVVLINVTATRIVGCYLESGPAETAPSILFDGDSCYSIVIENCNIGAPDAPVLIDHQDVFKSGAYNQLRSIRISNNTLSGSGALGKVFKSAGIVMGLHFSNNFLVSFPGLRLQDALDIHIPVSVVIEDDYGYYYFGMPTEDAADYPIVHFATDALRLEYPQTPATAGAAGLKGEICWDAGFLYVCVDTNTWKKVAIATW